jgi:hypothetical protein
MTHHAEEMGFFHSHIKEADLTIGAFSRCTTGTMYQTLDIGQWHGTPVMVGYIRACSVVGRLTRPPRTLHRRFSQDGRFSGDKPLPVPELRVACCVCVTLHALLVPLAFLAATGGAVLAGLAVGVVPLQAAKIMILRSIGVRIRNIVRHKHDGKR